MAEVVSARALSAAEPLACAHCGAEVRGGRPVPGEAPAFCCRGCAAVYRMLHQEGLGTFYSLRDQLGADRPAAVDAAAIETAGAAYRHFDDPDFLARYARTHPGEDDLRSIDLYLEGVHCAACVWVTDQLPRLLPGVRGARLDFARSVLRLEWAPAQIELGVVAARLHRLGYPSHPAGADTSEPRRRAARTELLRLGMTFALAANVMLLSIAGYAGAEGGRLGAFLQWTTWLLTLPQITWGAWPFLRGALAGLRAGVAHMDLPISLGLVAGFTASTLATVRGEGAVYYDSICVLVFLLLGGRWLQRRGQSAALQGSELLWTLTPAVAWRVTEGEAVPIPTGRLAPGDRVRVEGGALLPADGRLVESEQEGGEAAEARIDLAILTGESQPLRIAPQGRLWAGARNVGAALEMEVEAIGAASRIGRLLATVGGPGADPPAPIVRWADQLAGRFVVAVLALAALGGAAWWWATGDAARAFEVIVSLLVVSCPCALGLATPIALAVARGRAGRAGLLLRSPAMIERLARAREIVFDKTGTLTEGRLGVESATLPPGWLPGAVAALEAGVEHPIAQAIARWGHSDVAGPVTERVERPGLGVEGRIGDRQVAVGAPGWLDPGGLRAAEVEAAAAAGRTPVVIAVDGALVGLIALSDRVRPEAASVVAQLHALGLKVALCSGDHQSVARRVGRALGIEDAAGGIDPEGKARAVARAGVVMVGDGVNDAPALRAADVGVAIAGGAEAALHTAHVFLRGGLAQIPALITGSRRTLAVVRRNLVISLIYNLIFAALALAGHITPLAAAILMPVSSLTVVATSALSRTFDDRPAAGPIPQSKVLPPRSR